MWAVEAKEKAEWQRTAWLCYHLAVLHGVRDIQPADFDPTEPQRVRLTWEQWLEAVKDRFPDRATVQEMWARAEEWKRCHPGQAMS